MKNTAGLCPRRAATLAGQKARQIQMNGSTNHQIRSMTRTHHAASRLASSNTDEWRRVKSDVGGAASSGAQVVADDVLAERLGVGREHAPAVASGHRLDEVHESGFVVEHEHVDRGAAT